MIISIKIINETLSKTILYFIHVSWYNLYIRLNKRGYKMLNKWQSFEYGKSKVTRFLISCYVSGIASNGYYVSYWLYLRDSRLGHKAEYRLQCNGVVNTIKIENPMFGSLRSDRREIIEGFYENAEKDMERFANDLKSIFHNYDKYEYPMSDGLSNFMEI